jgi:O-antigen/teichoic acid export membrane protein
MVHINTMSQESNYLSLSISQASILINFCGKFLGLLSLACLANFFSENAFGFYSYLISLAAFIAVFLKLGMPPFLTKNTSSLLASRNFSDLSYLLNSVGRYFIISFVLMLIFILSLSSKREAELFNEITYLELIFCILIAYAISFGEILSSIIRGMGFIRSALYPENIVRPIIFLFLLLGTAKLSSLNIFNTLFLFLTAYIISNFIYYLVKRKIVELHPDTSTVGKGRFIFQYQEMFSFFVFSLLQVVFSQFSFLLFPFFSSYDELAIYRIAFSGGFLLTAVLLAVSSANVHLFSNFYSQNQLTKLRNHANECSWITFSYGFFFIAFSCASAPYLLPLVLQESYSASLTPFYIIAIAQLFNSAFGLASSVLQMSRFQYFNNISMVISLLIGIIYFVFHVKDMGAVGASISFSISILLYVFLSQLFCKILLGFFVYPRRLIS